MNVEPLPQACLQASPSSEEVWSDVQSHILASWVTEFCRDLWSPSCHSVLQSHWKWDIVWSYCLWTERLLASLTCHLINVRYSSQTFSLNNGKTPKYSVLKLILKSQAKKPTQSQRLYMLLWNRGLSLPCRDFQVGYQYTHIYLCVCTHTYKHICTYYPFTCKLILPSI